MKNKNFISFYKSCIFVKGFKNTIICDLQRNRYFKIANPIASILKTIDNISFSSFLDSVDQDYRNEFKSLVDLLLFENLVFMHAENSCFKELDMYYKTHRQINNAIIDLDVDNLDLVPGIVDQLAELKAVAIQLRSFNKLPKSTTISLLDYASTKIRFVELITEFSDEKSVIDILKKLNSQYFIHLTFHSASFDRTVVYGNKKAEIITDKINGEICCGNVSNDMFNINIETFMEAYKHNLCLNRKISIDPAGNIKNCPSMPHSYGNIKDTTLREALEHPDFKKYWYIHKDQIEVCKDCEFRYICTDCRAYLEDPDNLYSKPLKCGYNPYTGEWQEWSTNPLKQRAIEYYGMQELVKKEIE